MKTDEYTQTVHKIKGTVKKISRKQKRSDFLIMGVKHFHITVQTRECPDGYIESLKLLNCVCVDLVTGVLLCSASFTNSEQRVWPLNGDIMMMIVIILITNDFLKHKK